MRLPRSVAALVGALVAGLVVPLGAVDASASPTTGAPTSAVPSSASSGPGPTVLGARVHTMPFGATPAKVRSKPTAAPAGAHLTYLGGRVVSNLHTVGVLYGAGTYKTYVTGGVTPNMSTFLTGVTNSVHMDWLDAEYNTVAPSGSTKTNQRIGRGTNGTQVSITPAAGNNGSTITDAQVQSELAAQIIAGHVAPPVHDAAGNNNTEYVLYFPLGKSICDSTSCSMVAGGFCAYHGTIANVSGFGEVYYAVMPDFTPAGGGCGGDPNEFNDATSVLAHEFVETITDPEVGLATVVGPPLAWYDNTNGEIGDICNAQQGTVLGGDGVTYVVQKEFSNAANDCVVSRPTPAIISAPSATFTVGASGTFSVTTSGSPAPSLTETGALPSGLTFVDNHNGTATLAGTAAAGTAGSYPLTLAAANGVLPNTTQSFTLTVNQAPAITSAASTTMTSGTAGSFTVTTSGVPNATITRTGALPSGVTFTDNGTGTATLAGTPAAGTGGSYPLTITAHNGVGADATQSFLLTVHQAAAVTSANAATFIAGTVGNVVLTASGSPAPSLAVTGTLPGGISFHDNLNGSATLSGTAGASTGGTYALTVTAHNGIGADATQSFTLTVRQAPAITSGATATFGVGASGTFHVATTGFPAAALTGASPLPSGVTFTDNGDGTGTLSGTPANGTVGSYPFTLHASNGVGASASQSFTLSVVPGLAITSGSSATFVAGTPGSFTVTATGLPTPSLHETGALPSGVVLLDLGNGTATLSGTPATGTAGTYPVTLTASNGAAPNVSQSFTLTVHEAPAITSAASSSATIGDAVTFTVTATGSPVSALAVTGPLPTGVTFTDNGNGTATLGGTPASGSAGSYPLTITAHNGVGGDATQALAVTVATRATALLYSGATTGTYSDPVAAQAILTDVETGLPLPGQPVHLAVGTQGVDVSTSSASPAGVGAASISLTQPDGAVSAGASFAGDATYSGSSVAVGFSIAKETALVSTLVGNPRFVTTTHPTAGALTLRATVRELADGHPGDPTRIPSVSFVLTPVGGGARRACTALPTSSVNRMVLNAATGVWSVSCTFAAGTPLSAYDVAVSVGTNGSYQGRTDDVLLVSNPAAAGARGAGTLSGAAMPAGTTASFAFTAHRVGSAVRGQLIYVVTSTNRTTGAVTQHVLTSTSLTGLTMSTARAPFRASVSALARLDGVASYRVVLAVQDTTGAVRDGDRYAQTVTAPPHAPALPSGLVRKAMVISSGDVRVR